MQRHFDEEGRPLTIEVPTGLVIPENALRTLNPDYDQRIHSMSSIAHQAERFDQFASAIIQSLMPCMLGTIKKSEDN